MPYNSLLLNYFPIWENAFTKKKYLNKDIFMLKCREVSGKNVKRCSSSIKYAPLSINSQSTIHVNVGLNTSTLIVSWIGDVVSKIANSMAILFSKIANGIDELPDIITISLGGCAIQRRRFNWRICLSTFTDKLSWRFLYITSPIQLTTLFVYFHC